MLMESKVLTCTKKFKFVLMITIITGLIATGVTLSNASAEKQKLDVGADVSVKGEIGKSGMEENTSASANVSVSSSGTSEKFQAESHENYQASSEMQTQSHGNYKMSYEKMNADAKNSFTVETEHHIYKPGGQVSIEGSIWSSLIATVGGISSVSIQVTDNGGNVVYTGKGQVTSDGDYS